MKTASTYILAICLLASLLSVAAAQEGAPPAREFRSLSPEEAQHQLDRQWWRQVDKNGLPEINVRKGTWLLNLQTYDASGKPLNESERPVKAGSFGSSFNRLVGGQASAGDFTELDDYSLLMWLMPSNYDAAFREYGYLDWPSDREGIKVVQEDGTELDTSRPDLSEEQCRDLFSQFLEHAAVVEIDGLQIYLYSAGAEYADIQLSWADDGVVTPLGRTNNFELHLAELKQHARPAAEVRIHFANGGERAGGESSNGGQSEGGGD